MIIITDIQQGTEAWFKEKLGKPSASNASKIIRNDGKPSTQREGYLYELVAETLTGVYENGYKNDAMLTGQEREAEAREFYSFTNSVEVEQVGMIYKDKDKKVLCSPDGLINREHGLEMKNPLSKTQVKYLLDGCLPSEYFSQVQFSLFVTGFPFWDFLSYVPTMRPLMIRVEPDAKFQAALKIELEKFIEELDETVNKLRKE